MEHGWSGCGPPAPSWRTPGSPPGGRLRALLSNARICGQLDLASEAGGARDWTWRDVYRCSWACLKLEAENQVPDEANERQSKNGSSM